MNKQEISVGDRFGKLTIKELLGKIDDKDRAFYCIAKCDCGNEEKIKRSEILRRERYMCKKCKLAELSFNNKLKIKIGSKYGNLTVLEELGAKGKGHHFCYKVRCSCGNEEIARATELNAGRKKHCVSCGIKNGNGYKHGMCKTRLYVTWRNMISRCHNIKDKQFNLYGERGIRVCEEWRNNFKSFYDWAINNGYNENLSIDRINNDGSYEPSNCRWANDKEQANNRRTNHNVEIEGEVHNISEWCKLFGINVSTVRDRIRRGWNEIEAITTPKRR